MLLLVTGASGVGKSTARVGATTLLDDSFEAVELWHLGPIPPVPTIAWRQEMAEVAVRRAIELEPQGRHVLLAGDPVAAGEVLAAPSADQVDVAVLLLDADAESQTARLRATQQPEEWLPNNLGFAEWMRHHAVNPSHVPEALTTDAWERMRWERWVERPADDKWAMTVLDTSAREPGEVAELVADWCRKAVRGEVPVFRAGWFN
jgi:hypothetical protein